MLAVGSFDLRRCAAIQAMGAASSFSLGISGCCGVHPDNHLLLRLGWEALGWGKDGERVDVGRCAPLNVLKGLLYDEG